MNEIKKIIPSHIYEKIIGFGDELEEIRLRKNKYLIVRVSSEMKVLHSVKISANDIDYILQNATDFSIHTHIEQIKQGFLTYLGHRIGISGSVILKNNEIHNFSDIYSLNIRVAKKKVDIDKEILKSTINKNTLIISQPNVGKTTLLREIIRFLSGESCNISVVDERFEINDIANLGDFVDFISGTNKKDGAIMMLKTMSPDYIILDEITDNLEIIDKIIDNGVKIIATIHGKDYKSLGKVDIFSKFNNFIEICVNENKRKYNVKGSGESV